MDRMTSACLKPDCSQRQCNLSFIRWARPLLDNAEQHVQRPSARRKETIAKDKEDQRSHQIFTAAVGSHCIEVQSSPVLPPCLKAQAAPMAILMMSRRTTGLRIAALTGQCHSLTAGVACLTRSKRDSPHKHRSGIHVLQAATLAAAWDAPPGPQVRDWISLFIVYFSGSSEER